MSQKPLLDIRDLHTSFYTDDGIARAVDGVDLQLYEGEILALVGESGCGKSVTAHSVLRLVSPPGRIDSGEILFQGVNLLSLPYHEMYKVRGGQIAMIYQEPMSSLNPLMRVGAQIREAIGLHMHKKGNEAHELAVDILRAVGIPDPERRVHEYPHQMSGGMRQRVMIAMGMVCNPKVMIADEPTTALDVSIQAQILDLLRALVEQRQAAVLLITHDLGVVAETAQRVAVMYTGKVVEEAPVNDLFTSPAHPYTQGLLMSIPDISRPVPTDRILPTISGTVPSLLNLPSGCRFRSRCEYAMDVCEKEMPPLVSLTPRHRVRCWLYE